MENKIKIHEFSTGIEVKGTQTNWESVGFTGEYMNRTLDKIPQAVLNSIANREFALAEGVDRAEPAIVGRVVRGYEESWSVVAVVIRGRDDRGRGVSLYRYFLRQGDTGIETILRWMKQRDQQGLSSEFDPFDKMAIGQPHKVDVSSITTHGVDLQNFEKELGQSPPIIVPNNKPCTALVLNHITRELPESNGDRSWAYKVAMLERPESFQVIYPADAKAETIIKEFFKRPRSALMIPSGASGIKAAIKAIIKGNVVNLEHIQTLENTLGNSQLDDNYWISILDTTAVSQGVKENIENPRYVRFLTLKAMLVPTFLPDFMKLLTHSKEWERHYDTSLNLQKLMLKEAPNFTNNFPKLSEYLKRGICYTIDYLVDEPKILKQSQLLLTKPGFWSQLYKESLSKELENVLGLMGKKGQNLQSLNTQYPQWSSLLGKINTFWYPPERTDNKYKSLAELFEKVETAKLAAIFYQIAEGSVPKKLFDSIWPSDKKSESIILFNKKIDRKKNVGDRISSVFNDVQTNYVLSRKTAIQKLICNSVKWEYLITLDDALDDSIENQPNDNESWESFCDKLGAKGALNKNYYSERIIKLLTLKAMLMPDFLPLFLKWLAKSKKSETYYNVSQNLQKEILEEVPKFTQDCSKLSKQLKCGICIVIHSLVDDPDILQESKWLLTKPGLWSKVYQESLSGELERDIDLISDHISGKKGLQFQAIQYRQWRVLLNDIVKFWLPQERRDSRYLTLGDLFEAVKTPNLAQVFYGIGGNDINLNSSVQISGGSGIKAAIKAVINNRVKREHIETLENALGNSQVNENYWKSILDKEGASGAFREKIYGDRYVRLLTLKAMLFPSFLPDFLTWLANSKESEKHYNTSLKLQELISGETQTFTKDFPELSTHLKKGICRVIDRLSDEPKMFKELKLLLISQSGLWGQVYPLVSENLENVLNEIKYRQNSGSLESEYPQWSSLLKKIHKFWYPQIIHDHNDKKLTKYYKNLTELFEKLETTKLAAIFYQIGEGSVPKSLFLEVPGNKRKKNTVLVLGMEINRRQEIGDYVKEVCCFLFKTVDIGGINMPRFIALIILLVVFAGGFILGRFSLQLDPDNDNDKTKGDRKETQNIRLSLVNAIKYKQTDQAIHIISYQLTFEIKRLAQYNYNVLLEAGTPMYFYMDPNNIKTKDIIIYCIKKTIGLPQNFQYSKIKEDNEKWKQFSEAIKKYQKLKFSKPKNADGVISPNGKTQEWLEEDIRKYLKIEDSLELQNPQFSSPITVPQ